LRLSDAWKGKAKDIFNAAEKEGLMILQAGPDVMRFAPSLVVKTPISCRSRPLRTCSKKLTQA
jgi:acetylornithine/N-succinyldiaminopimelate aminotransferase